MEPTEINMVELLKDKPREYPLYSPMYGNLWLAEIEGAADCRIITCYRYPLLDGDSRAILNQEDTVSFYPNGTTGDENFNVTKERMLFTMDEWSAIKKLAVVDFYARVPYHPMVNFNNYEGCDYELTLDILYNFSHNGLKVYLRSMSSMTEEEKVELSKYAIIGDGSIAGVDFVDWVQRKDVHKYIDWLNAHHFDYRGLIKKGLALEAPKGMYDYNTQTQIS